MCCKWECHWISILSLASFYLFHSILPHSPCLWAQRGERLQDSSSTRKTLDVGKVFFYVFPGEIHFAFMFLMAHALCLLRHYSV